MTTCPVRALTPEVTSALTWFELTHQLVAQFGTAYWMRTALPQAGGIGEQDARLMDALEVLRSVHDQVVADELNRRANEREVERWHYSQKRRRDD